MNISLLLSVAAKIVTGRELMGSRWNNAECEFIVAQTIWACKTNYVKHGDAFSWVGKGVMRGRAECGTDNSKGLRRLIEEGSLVMEKYVGPLMPPDGIATEDGVFLVLRVRESLLIYVNELISK